MDNQEQVKQIQRDYYKQYRDNNKDKINEYQREYRAKNKDRVKQYNKTYWLKKASLIQNAQEVIKVSTSIKALNDVMRNPKTYSQTKALCSYLWVRADSKSGLSYPPKAQILSEVNLTEKLYNQCLAVLKNNGYIKEVIITKKDKEGKTYNINAYDLNYYGTPKIETKSDN